MKQKYSHEYYEKNKERIMAQHRNYIERNKDKVLLARKTYYKKKKGDIKEYLHNYRMNNQAKVMFLQSRRRAKKENLEFTITEQDIIIPEYCPYLNIKLEMCGGHISSPSLDRIDNSKGYVSGNVQVISHLANACKRDLSIEQLQLFANNILIIHSKPNNI